MDLESMLRHILCIMLVFFTHHTRFKMFINHTLQKSKIMDAAKVFLMSFKSTFFYSLLPILKLHFHSMKDRRSEADKKPIEKQTID